MHLRFLGLWAWVFEGFEIGAEQTNQGMKREKRKDRRPKAKDLSFSCTLEHSSFGAFLFCICGDAFGEGVAMDTDS